MSPAPPAPEPGRSRARPARSNEPGNDALSRAVATANPASRPLACSTCSSRSWNCATAPGRGSAPRPSCARGPAHSTARFTRSNGVDSAFTTSTTPSAMDASSDASVSRPTGGVSMMTQSNTSRASSTSRRIRSDVIAPMGSDVGRPAGNTVRRLDSRCSGSFGSSALIRPSDRPGAPDTWKIECCEGRRRSASISSTFRRYDSLSVSARFAAVRLLPSPATALATIATLKPFAR